MLWMIIALSTFTCRTRKDWIEGSKLVLSGEEYYSRTTWPLMELSSCLITVGNLHAINHPVPCLPDQIGLVSPASSLLALHISTRYLDAPPVSSLHHQTQVSNRVETKSSESWGLNRQERDCQHNTRIPPYCRIPRDSVLGGPSGEGPGSERMR